MYSRPLLFTASALVLQAQAASAQTAVAPAQVPRQEAVKPIATVVTIAPAAPDTRSTFDGYRRFNADEPLTDWRRVNALVLEAGGWREYAKEAARANAKAPAESGERK